MSKIIGIDLGTTNSCVAVIEDGFPKVIMNNEGARTTPSVVAFNPHSGEWMVGASAMRQAIRYPRTTYSSIQGYMGLPFVDSIHKQTLVPYIVERSETGGCLIDVAGKKITPQGISALILCKLKESAETYLGEKVTKAVITVPSYFNDHQRRAVREAGAIAGLDVMRIICSPSAACLVHAFEKKIEGAIAIFDFGGGTFDISILEVSEGVVEVMSTNGDTSLGGDNVDQLIVDWLVEEFRKAEGIDLSKQAEALQRLKEAAEKAKCELSSTTQTDINLPYITAEAGNHKHLQHTLSRARFEAMLEPILTKLRVSCENALKDAKLRRHEINKVFLLGGSTRIPKVQDLVKETFDIEPNQSLNRDEAVATGAALHGGVIAGETKGLLLVDVTSFSLGINVNGGQMSLVIPRNTTIPTRHSEIYTTTSDNQKGIEIEVFQGERPLVAGNKLLGHFHLAGIPPAPRGLPQIEVIFDIDANGIVHVTAKDIGSGKAMSVNLNDPSKPSWTEGASNSIAPDHAEAPMFRETTESSDGEGEHNPFTTELKEERAEAQWSEAISQGPVKTSWLGRLLGRR